MNCKLSAAVIESGLSDVASADFRQGMAHIAAAVHLITTDGIAGQAGFTASAVCSVSDQPATLLVCLNRQASVFETFKANQVLCVNTLHTEQVYLSQLFSGKTPMSVRFAQGNWGTLKTGAPVLGDALVAFDCVVLDSYSVATHDILICQVKAIQAPHQAQPLLYFNRMYAEPMSISH